MKIRKYSWIGLLVVLTISSMNLTAQTTTALLRGTVVDPSGAPLPDAQVTVTNTATGVSREVMTTGVGDYVVADLPYGPYEIVVVKQGFQRLNRTGVQLNVGERTTIDLQLSVGEISDTVTVTEQAPLLRTADASLGQVIDNVKVENMPIVGRSFDQLLYLVPGSQVSPTGQFSGVSFLTSAGPAIGVSFNGMRTEMNEYLLDGTHTTYPIFGTPSFYPSVETLQEFRVETQNFSTELSRTAGGQILLSTKSGTNQFHGSAYEFLRNDNLEARNPFALTRPETKSNLFGGTVGGPIFKDKTFFFAAYEGFRAVVPSTQTTTVPTEDDRNGILTDPVLHPNPIIDPTTGQAFPGNIIPQSRIDPIAANILALTPLPNLAGFPNFTANTSNSRSFDQVNVRVDHNIGSIGRLFGRWSGQPGDSSVPRFVTVDPSISDAFGQNVVVGFDAGSGRFFNAIRFGYTTQKTGSLNTVPEDVTPQNLGFPSDEFQANPRGIFIGIPNFRVQNYADGFDGFGQRGGSPGDNKTQYYEISDNMTLVRGNHTLKWGGMYARNSAYLIFSGNERGTYSFDGTYTGDPLADFLLGLPRNLSRSTATPTPTFNSNQFAVYFGDSWKVNRDLTIDYGLAYSYNGQPYEIANRIGSFFVGPVDGVPRIQFVSGGDPRFPRSLMFRNPLNFDPRVGIAWRPFGSERTVVRVGAGYFHSLLTMNNRLNNAFGPPFGVDESFQNPDVPVATLRRAFIPELITGTGSTSRNIAAPMDFKDAAVSMWNLNIQREISPGTLVQVGYVGNTAIHLDVLTRFNVARPGPGPFAPRRPYPLDPGPIFLGETNATSTYHAFRAQFEKRLSAGFSVLSYYTLAKHLDNATALADGFGGQFFIQDPENIAAEKARSSDDARHRFVTSYVWQLPVGAGRRWLTNSPAVVDAVFGGWQVAGVATFMSGMPISARQSGNRANTEQGDTRPDRICDGNLGSGRTLERWFDTSCYVLTPLFQYGNAGRNTIEGPGLVNFDLNLSKDIRFMEERRVQLRAEFFNLTNTPYFGKPNTTVGSPTFGQITSLARGGTANTRIIQLGLRIVF